jgi:ribose transport system substrate-binding protein
MSKLHTVALWRGAPRWIAAVGLFVCLYAAGCDSRPVGSAGGAKPDDDKLRIAVIPKGSTHIFWQSVKLGADRAGSELGVEIIWKAPVKENDRSMQISLVEQFVSDGVSGIVLAPLDDVALRRPVEVAARSNIPVVIFDSALQGTPGKDFVSYVGTNNREGGRMGGEEMVRLLEGKGNVIVLRYMEGSASTTEREEGFLEVIAKHPEMHVLLSNRFAGATMGEAKDSALNIIDKLREADGVFCPCEPVTFGMLLALKIRPIICWMACGAARSRRWSCKTRPRWATKVFKRW